jgi:uncharacterized protein YndB with AHSA1/START domain
MTPPSDPNLGPSAALAVRQSIHVDLPPSEAFRLFTDGIGEWWPLEEGYSYGGDRADGIFLEPVVGGRFFERFVDGDELQVGTVVSCLAPDRIVFTWRSPEWPGDTEVDVHFVPDGAGTSVMLEHRGWEQLGPDGAAIAEQWANGWPRVVAAFAAHAAS